MSHNCFQLPNIYEAAVRRSFLEQFKENTNL